MAEVKKRLKAGSASVRSDTQVDVNLKGVEAGGSAPRIPEGSYRAKVQSAKAGKAKSTGNDLVLWKFEIIEGPQSGVVIWDRTMLLDQSLWTFRRTLEALKIKVKDSTMTIPLERLVGKTCGIEVVDGDEFNGKIKSEINDVFREELLEEKDEPEEEIEEEEDLPEDEDEEEEESGDDDEDDFEDVDLDDEEL